MYMLSYKLRDDIERESESNDLLQLKAEMVDLMDDMVEFAHITNEHGDVIADR